MASDNDERRAISRSTCPYTPLNCHNRCIRLIQLLPGEPDDDIECSLLEVTLNDNPQYYALSYTWGSPYKTNGLLDSRTAEEPAPVAEVDSHTTQYSTKHIFLNGYVVKVVENLWFGLRHLRHIGGLSKSIWIDALCIKPTDVTEREHHVRMMSDIYANADLVVVWLGEDDENHSCFSGIELIEELSSKIEASDFSLAFENRNAEVYLPILASFKFENRFRENPGEWRSFKEFINRSWWNRLWTLQEISLSREAVLLTNTNATTWAHFLLALGLLLVHLEEMGEDINNRELYDCLIPGVINEDYHARRPITLLRLARLAGPRVCSDARDQIFGLVSLVSHPEAKELVDYSRSVREVYEVATSYMIREENNLSVFQFNKTPKRCIGLPSWVPDWSIAQVYAPGDKNLFNAAMGMAPYLVSCCHGQISLKGAVLDAVDRLYPSIELRDDELNDFVNKLPQGPYSFQACRTFHEMSTCGFVDRSSPQARIEKSVSWSEAFWRTLVSDNKPFEKGVERRRLDAEVTVSEKIHAAAQRGTLIPLILPNLFEKVPAAHELLDGNDAPNSLFYMSKRGLMGRGSFNLQTGDLLVVLLGSSVPFALRGDGDGYILVGHTYVHGIMDGEAIEALGDNPEFVTFSIH